MTTQHTNEIMVAMERAGVSEEISVPEVFGIVFDDNAQQDYEGKVREIDRAERRADKIAAQVQFH
jgi:hypothetical protein